MTNNSSSNNLKISAKTFISTILIMFALMLFAGVLTRVLPQGSFSRVADASGVMTVVPGTYRETEGAPLPVWRWFTALVEVFAADGAATMIVIIIFLILLGGVFGLLDKCGVFKYLITVTVKRFGERKYRLLAVIALVCMVLGSTVGMLEESVAFIPLTVALALALGWDSLLGMAMCFVSMGFGFAAGTLNPFTVIIAQRLADVPLYSGLWLRIIVFAISYGVLVFFLIRYARRIDRDPTRSMVYESDLERRKKFIYDGNDPILDNKQVKKASLIFGGALLLEFVYVIISMFVPGLSDYTMIIIVVLLTAGSLVAGAVSRYREKGMMGDFFRGCLNLLPSVLVIMMAMSVKHIITVGGIMDTILYAASSAMEGVSPRLAILMVYGLVLAIQFFIGGASAKAFLIIPIIAPLSDLIGITRQSVVLTFCFADGFTNVFFPTNPMVLIGLGLVGLTYGKWFRFLWKPQLAMLAITAAISVLSVIINYT